MTTKPKTRKAPAAETGINPKLIELAAKLDEAHAHARQVEGLQKDADDIHAAEDVCADAYAKISKLEFKLAEIPATNPEELKLKARYAAVEYPDPRRGSGSRRRINHPRSTRHEPAASAANSAVTIPPLARLGDRPGLVTHLDSQAALPSRAQP